MLPEAEERDKTTSRVGNSLAGGAFPVRRRRDSRIAAGEVLDAVVIDTQITDARHWYHGMMKK